MTLMKGLVRRGSGRGGEEATVTVHGSALATAGGDGTGETGRGRTLAERRNGTPSNRPGACLVIERCNEKTGRNLQEVMGKG